MVSNILTRLCLNEHTNVEGALTRPNPIQAAIQFVEYPADDNAHCGCFDKDSEKAHGISDSDNEGSVSQHPDLTPDGNFWVFFERVDGRSFARLFL